MANFFEKTDIPVNRFVAFGSRYEDSKVVYYTDNRILTFNTYKKKSFPVSEQDKFLVVSKGFEYRPDLVSQRVYNTPDFWWRIMEANNIKDIFDFKAGINIRIPNTLF